MRQNYETIDGKIDGLSYGTPEYDKAIAELDKLGMGINTLGDQK